MTLEEIANKNKEIMEDNKLLLTDLCSRLPYRTMVLIKDGGIEPLLNVNVDTFICNGQRDLPKPYLRPMSSMTEEELNECVRKSGIKDIECPNWQDVPKEKQFEARLNHSIAVFLTDSNNVDWLNAHHFDYRGLINKGLAIEAPEDMYKTEKIMKKPDFEKDALAALRSIKAAIQNEKTNGTYHELTDADIVGLIQKLIKQRKESIDIYSQAGRDELAEEEQKEMYVLTEYVPKQLTEEEIEEKVKSIIAETGASSMKDMGKVMGLATQRMKGLAEGKTISQIVKNLLSN